MYEVVVKPQEMGKDPVQGKHLAQSDLINSNAYRIVYWKCLYDTGT